MASTPSQCASRVRAGTGRLDAGIFHLGLALHENVFVERLGVGGYPVQKLIDAPSLPWQEHGGVYQARSLPLQKLVLSGAYACGPIE